MILWLPQSQLFLGLVPGKHKGLEKGNHKNLVEGNNKSLEKAITNILYLVINNKYCRLQSTKFSNDIPRYLVAITNVLQCCLYQTSFTCSEPSASLSGVQPNEMKQLNKQAHAVASLSNEPQPLLDNLTFDVTYHFQGIPPKKYISPGPKYPKKVALTWSIQYLVNSSTVDPVPPYSGGNT